MPELPALASTTKIDADFNEAFDSDNETIRVGDLGLLTK